MYRIRLIIEKRILQVTGGKINGVFTQSLWEETSEWETVINVLTDEKYNDSDSRDEAIRNRFMELNNLIPANKKGNIMGDFMYRVRLIAEG